MVTKIPLGPAGCGLVALIDDEDLALVSTYSWHQYKNGRNIYAMANLPRAADGRRSAVYMHRVVMGVRNGDSGLDHVNGNGLDNRRKNLRPSNQGQNLANTRIDRSNNTSGFKGISQRPSGRWGVRIGVEGGTICLGTFDTPEQAAQAYNKAALMYFGEFARINEI